MFSVNALHYCTALRYSRTTLLLATYTAAGVASVRFRGGSSGHSTELFCLHSLRLGSGYHM